MSRAAKLKSEQPAERARILKVTPDEYHRDPCETPSLSSSIAHTLITRSPAHAHLRHPRLGNQPAAPTDPMNEGHLIHRLLLGKGTEVEVIAGFADFRKMAARDARDAAIEAGRVPMLEHKYAALLAAAEALHGQIRGYDIDLNGESEIAIEWRELGNIGDVLCRGLLDHLVIDRAVIYDVKKIRSADLRTCARHAIEYGYDIQRAAYVSAVEKLRPDLAGRVDFVWLFCELEPPYAVVPARPDGALRELGEMRWQRAVGLWEHCLSHGYWPTYTNAITTIEAPPWALAQESF